MPELPEVETVKRILEPVVSGKKILDIRIFREANVLSGADNLRKSLIGESFLSVDRKGKFLIFHLTGDFVLLSHLRMEGKYFERKAGSSPEKHDILIFDFYDGSALAYNDVRKFGVLELKQESDYLSTPPLSELGKEPKDIDALDLYNGLQKRTKTPIKEALLDQTLIAGLGNIYDDEVLFATKISPKRLASSISLDEAKSIKEEATRILDMAIENGGSTIKSYHPKEGMDGRMQSHLLAYGHGGEPCPRCGFPLRKISIGGRGTVYCPFCQKIEGKPLLVAVSGPIASGKSAVSSYLSKRGYYLLDCDKLAHESYSDISVKEAIKEEFGPLSCKEGNIDKSYLSSQIASSNEKKKALEKIIHPYVYRKIDETIASGEHKKIVLDIPLLAGSPYEEEADLIIYVEADESLRKERLLARGVDPSKYLSINDKSIYRRIKKESPIHIDGGKPLKDTEEALSKMSFLFDEIL